MTQPERSRSWVVVTLLLLSILVFLSALGYGIRQSKLRADENAKATTALCILRADRLEQIQSSREFLRTHPDGFAGISPAVLLENINNQQATVDALSILDC